MKFQHQVLCVPPVVMLICSLLPGTALAQFSQQGPKLVGTGAVGVFAFGQGFSVSLSGDGNTAIVGGPDDDNFVGATWVYTRSGGVWSQLGSKLVGSGALGSARQGDSVSLSADGNTAIVGGPGDNGFVGAAWVYTRSGGAWSKQAKLVGTGAIGPAEQGSSVSAVSLSADGNTAIVGGPVDNNLVGAAWVYTRSGGVWTQEAKLVGIGVIGPFAGQGGSVSLSSDGNTAIVGGADDNYNNATGTTAGAAWVYTRSGGVWSQQAKLVDAGAIGPAGQGDSVSLSADGNTAILGGPGDNKNVGAAWVYTRSGGMWSQQAKLVGTDAVGNAAQGISVSLSGDGNTAIVGGTNDNGHVGAAWAFTRSDGVWSQLGSKLVGSDAIGQAFEGTSVSLSGDGNTAIVGGFHDNGGVGAAWVYAQPVFAGTPGKANCHGKSVSALAKQFGGLNAAAAVLGYADVSAMQNAIMVFCDR